MLAMVTKVQGCVVRLVARPNI